MKKSEIYKKLQKLVVTSSIYSAEEKMEMLRVLFAQEDYALYAEGLEEQLAQEEPRCEREESEV